MVKKKIIIRKETLEELRENAVEAVAELSEAVYEVYGKLDAAETAVGALDDAMVAAGVDSGDIHDECRGGLISDDRGGKAVMESIWDQARWLPYFDDLETTLEILEFEDEEDEE